MDRTDVLGSLKEHLAIMERGANHAALKLAIREIERLQPNKHPETHEDRQKAISDFLAVPENSKSVIEGNPFFWSLIPTKTPE